MLRSLCAVLSFLIAFGCAEGGAITYEKKEFSMPISANHQMVVPAVGAPFREIECPDDSADVQAADIRRPTAALLANDEWLQREVITFWEYTVGTFGQTGALIDETTGWTTTTLSVSVGAVNEGDDLDISAEGNWLFNVASSSDVVAQLRLVVEESNGGPSVYTALPPIITQIDNIAAVNALPKMESYHLRWKHRVSAGMLFAGAILQMRIVDTTAGAGTGNGSLAYTNSIGVWKHNRKVN